MVERVSILCGHCGETHETVNEVRACAGLAPYPPAEATTTPMHCGREMIPIVSGYPGHSLIEARDRGEIQWTGTCMVFAHQPNWHCPSCGRSFTLPGGPNTGGLASVRMDGHGIDWDKVPDPPWWTKARMRLQYWITGDV